MKLKWLKRKPKEDAGVTWGIPWKQGNLDREESLILKGGSGTTIPLQTWPLAFWPDGSVKWTGHSAVLRGEIDSYKIERGNAQVQSNDVINLVETDESIEIDNGAVTISLLKQGQHLIETICSGNQLLANNGKLIAIHERRFSSDGMNVKEEEKLECIIERVEVEQKGPVRCVIKFTGNFSKKDKVKLLPFSLRLYIYAGTMEIKVVHTFFYDGNPEKDFVKGLGIELSVPIQGDPWNRHVRIAGDQGIFNEPGQLLKTRRHWDANGLYEKQINGDMVDLTAAENKTLIDHVKQNAIWNDFKISQDSANHYCFSKRTNDRQANVEGIHGKRALGFAYIGGERGGFAIGIKDFWQKHPTSLEVNHLTKENPKIKAWFWSPDAEAMDLRHYSDKTYETSAYEGFEEMRATPYGIANTSELFIQCYQEIPSNDDLLERAQEWQTTRLLVCEPEYYYESKTMGIWSLPDETNPVKAKIEKQLNHAIEFYQNEIEQRSWYGFWNYGDVMHTYDAVRHQWLYD